MEIFMSQQEYMTKEGLGRLTEKLAELKEELRLLRKYKGEEAIHAGDSWHDNPVFYQTEAQERMLMKSITDIEARIRNAEIIAPRNETSIVDLGTTVTVRFSDGTESIFTLLGEADSDPTHGQLSYKSPLGQALMHSKVGDIVSYEVKDFSEEIVVLAIDAKQ
jgi:transcription elongation factor GreA